MNDLEDFENWIKDKFRKALQIYQLEYLKKDKEIRKLYFIHLEKKL